jgi:hypothetical protein
LSIDKTCYSFLSSISITKYGVCVRVRVRGPIWEKLARGRYFDIFPKTNGLTLWNSKDQRRDEQIKEIFERRREDVNNLKKENKTKYDDEHRSSRSKRVCEHRTEHKSESESDSEEEMSDSQSIKSIERGNGKEKNEIDLFLSRVGVKLKINCLFVSFYAFSQQYFSHIGG